MTKIEEKNQKKQESKNKEDKNIKCQCKEHGTSNVIYGMGVVSALIYYLSTATSFWMGFLGVLKAVLWPAILVFELLKFLG